MRRLKAFLIDRPLPAGTLLITVALVAFYSNSFTTDWHYDDFHHIKENINIRKLSNIPLFFEDPTTFSRNPNTRMYRPLLMATHALNYQMGLASSRDGYNVFWYHLTNFLFHLLASLTVFLILRWLFTHRIHLGGVRPDLVALFGGLLFGLNTINTETVVYISSRSSGMATLFVLLSLFLYFKATSSDGSRQGLLVSSAMLYGCGLLSKEIAITLPAMLLFYELLLNRRESESTLSGAEIKRLALRLWAHGLVAAAYLGVRHVVLNENLAGQLITKGGTAAAPDLTAQLATQSRAWVLYLREWFLPTGLSIDKPFAVSRGFSDGKVLLSLAVIGAVIALVLWQRKKYPAVAFGAFWWFTALLPTSIFRLNVPVNDHRLYLSGFGFTLIFVYMAGKLYLRFREDGGWYFRVFVSTCIAVLVLMGLGTFKRNMAFATEETMWKDVILKDRNSVRGYNNLGIWYEQNGDFDKALTHYQQTIKLAPMFPNPYINVGNVYHKQKKYDAAEKWMKRAIELDRTSALANYNLGNILREAGKTQEAVGAYKRALELNPRYIEAANNLANIYFKERNYQEAIRFYQQALYIDPTFAMSYYNIALAHENLGQPAEAVASYEKFLRFWLGDRKYLSLATTKMETLKRQLSGPQGK